MRTLAFVLARASAPAPAHTADKSNLPPLPQEPIPSLATLPADYPASWVPVHDFNFLADLPGCAHIYPTGERGFSGLCTDGLMISIVLDANGAVEALAAASNRSMPRPRCRWPRPMPLPAIRRLKTSSIPMRVKGLPRSWKDAHRTGRIGPR